MNYELSQPALPQVLEIINSEDKINIKLLIPNNPASCAGHFPDYPIIPGYILLAWALHFLNNTWPLTIGKFTCRQIKFLNLVSPKLELKLEIIKKLNNKFNFQFQVRDQNFCIGEFGIVNE